MGVGIRPSRNRGSGFHLHESMRNLKLSFICLLGWKGEMFDDGWWKMGGLMVETIAS